MSSAAEGAPPLVLASASPRRRHVLEQLGLDFDVRVAAGHVEEEWDGREAPPEFARRMAVAKVRAVAVSRPEALVVGADTIVVLDGEVLGKPAGSEEARRMLRRLAGREHVVHTGVAARVPGGHAAAGVEATAVRFRELPDAEIAAYVATGEPLDKAGAYGIQGFGAALVEEVRGCYFNVMGLPVSRLLDVMARIGWTYAFPGRLVAREEGPPGSFGGGDRSGRLPSRRP